jgi:hypothetical protein
MQNFVWRTSQKRYLGDQDTDVNNKMKLMLGK